MKINAVCLTFILFLASCQEATVPFFANEESVKRELENDFICDELARAKEPYANSGEVSGIGMRQAFNICTTKQFLNIGKRKEDWDKYFNIRADLNFKEEILRVGEDFFPIGEITYYSDKEPLLNDRLAFSGVIDGKGHSILRLSVLFEEYNKRSVGIFPYIAKTGELRNLNFENIRIIHTKGIDFIDDVEDIESTEEIEELKPISLAGGVVGLSDGARFENIKASRVQVIHELDNEKSFSGIFSGVLINSILNGVSVYSTQSGNEAQVSGGLAGIILGGRFTDINLEIPEINAVSNPGGFAGVIEGKVIKFLPDIIDAPIEGVTINNLVISLLEDQESDGFGGIAFQAHDLSVENANVQVRKISDLKHYSGTMFGSATELELHNSSIFLNDDIVGDDSCSLTDGSHGRIGVAIGEVVNSEIRNLSIDLNSKDIKLENCQYVGIVSGRSVNSTLSHIEIKNGGELQGLSHVGGFVGEMNSSTLENSDIFIDTVLATNKYDFDKLDPVAEDDGTKCYPGVFLGGAVGFMNEGSVVKKVNVTAENIKSSIGKAALVGGLVGLNLGNISESIAKTKIIKGAHFVGGLVGANYSDNTFGKIKNNQVENTDYISGWKFTGGLLGSSGAEYAEPYKKPFCNDDFEFEESENHFGGEVLYNSARINNIYASEKMGGMIGFGYEAKVNSSFSHLNGALKKLYSSYLDEEDFFPAAEALIIVENNFGGFIGESINSSVRNSYVSSKNFEQNSVDGQSSVGGFVGYSKESEFFYNFSFLNTYGKTKKEGSCDGDESATSKVECEFVCESLDPFSSTGGNTAFKCNAKKGEDSSTYKIDQNANGLAHSIKVKLEKNEDEYVAHCKNILESNLSDSLDSIDKCVASFSCLKANGTIDDELTTRESCESMGYCGPDSLRYDTLGGADDIGDPLDNGYVNERDCCVNGDKHFLKNRWVRNYWVTKKSELLDFDGSITFWKKTGNEWSEDIEVDPEIDGYDPTLLVPKVGKFAGSVDIKFDHNSNSIVPNSNFVGNFSGGVCENSNNQLVQNEFGEGIDEYSTDDSDFYECKNSTDVLQDGLKNQFACNRLGDCLINPDQVTRGSCNLENSGTTWVPNSWEPKADLSTEFGTPETCVSLNQKNIKEKINVNLSIEQRQNLDTCNDSILRQMGRQDQVLYSTEKFTEDYFNYSYNPPLSFWNFNYFWEEVSNDVPVLFR